MKKTMWDLKEERLEQRLQALAQQGDWDGVVQALDDYDKTMTAGTRIAGMILIYPV